MWQIKKEYNKSRQKYPTYNKKKEANWIGHILSRNYVLEHTIEGNIEGLGRQGRKCKQLLDDLKETRRYWKMQQEALHRTL
jgi:hypothetical protein